MRTTHNSPSRLRPMQAGGFLGIILALAALPIWAQDNNATPAPAARDSMRVPVRSPEIGPDRHVTFRLRAPQAHEVVLSGEFMNGSKALEKDSSGLWSITIGPLEPEIYNYNFTIDGVKTIDPGNYDVKTGSTASTIASVLEVKGDQPAFYDAQQVPHGEIRTIWYRSHSLDSTRRLTIYTPPGYDHNSSRRYPVLYLFHGANADETAWTKLGHVNLILDNLLAQGKIKPFVVVMPFGYPEPPSSQAPASFRGFQAIIDGFSQDLIGDVIPYVQSHFRVDTDRDHRAIAGLSMGGAESLQIGLNHLDLFSYVGGFSAALRPPEFSKDFGGLTAHPATANHELHLLWIGCGTDDGLFKATQDFASYLDSSKVKYTLYKMPGAHTWIVWRHFLAEFTPRLF